MTKLYSIVKKQFVFFTALSLTSLISVTAFSQACVPITAVNCPTGVTENFQNTGGTTAGFTGDFELFTAPGQNPDRFLNSTNVAAGTTKTLSSPTFIAPSVGGTINLRFDLTGTDANVSNLTIAAQTTTGTILLCTGPILQDPGVNCFTFVTPVALANMPFRFVFTFTVTGQNPRTVQFDDFGTNVSPSNSPLPVNFTGFDAKKVEGGTQLTWKVAGEQNVKNYDVEKSTNGMQFSKVGTVTATGRDAYSFIDASSAQGKVFYRIRNNDVDGRYKYSVVLSFSNGKAGMILKAFPLPAKNSLTLQHSAANNGKISLTTTDGKLVKTVIPSAGSIQTNLDLTALKAGMYIIKFDNGNGNVESIKVVKQ
jgi:hypothetical protein